MTLSARFQSLSGFLGRCNPVADEAVLADDRFQSLSGFLGRCNRISCLGWSRDSPCFNPYRVFSGAATSNHISRVTGSQFVSIPIGFSRALQLVAGDDGDGSSDAFQSLSGFLGRCNHADQRFCRRRKKCFNPYRVFSGAATRRSFRCRAKNEMFQSLSGFLGRCNTGLHKISAWILVVSIPIGFSRALQRYVIRSVQVGRFGFNPYRVFSGAATRLPDGSADALVTVSIPIGFSRALQLPSSSWMISPARVSIPIGFSRALQRNEDMGELGASDSFNPYRVFSGAATQINLKSIMNLNSFNPYRVFSGAATEGRTEEIIEMERVSIPIGFSRALQQDHHGDIWR